MIPNVCRCAARIEVGGHEHSIVMRLLCPAQQHTHAQRSFFILLVSSLSRLARYLRPQTRSFPLVHDGERRALYFSKATTRAHFGTATAYEVQNNLIIIKLSVVATAFGKHVRKRDPWTTHLRGRSHQSGQLCRSLHDTVARVIVRTRHKRLLQSTTTFVDADDRIKPQTSFLFLFYERGRRPGLHFASSQRNSIAPCWILGAREAADVTPQAANDSHGAEYFFRERGVKNCRSITGYRSITGEFMLLHSVLHRTEYNES